MIVYFIVGVIILCIISSLLEKLWDVLKAILSVGLTIVICVGIFCLIRWLYSLIGYPVWLIGLLVFGLIIFNLVSSIRYFVKIGRARKLLRNAADIAERINREESDVIQEVEKEISAAIVEMQMATDAELYNKVQGEIDETIEALNREKRGLKQVLEAIPCFRTEIRQIDMAKEICDKKKIFIEKLQKLVDKKDVIVVSGLENGGDKSILSWDKKLYKSAIENPEPSNMLPTMHLEID